MNMTENFLIKYEFGRNFLMKYNGQESSPIIPEEVEIIGRRAFEKCGSINNIQIHKGVSEIREKAFAGCNNLKSVVMREEGADRWVQGVKLICDSAFEDCTSLSNVQFPKSLLKIGAAAFSGCQNLHSLEIPNIIVIGEAAFKRCILLTNVRILSFVEEIGSKAFVNCNRLSSVLLHEIAKESISPDTFKGCESLVILAPKNSYAIQYAQENNIQFEEF
jgi:hypothetical protein